jgi:hypothetical protein
MQFFSLVFTFVMSPIVLLVKTEFPISVYVRLCLLFYFVRWEMFWYGYLFIYALL